MYKKAAEYIMRKLNTRPSVGLILGSGLGDIANSIENPLYFDYKDIAGFPHTTVESHQGRFVVGECQGKIVIAAQGRFHHYEGYDMKQVILPVRVMAILGISTLIVTNAAGGINLNFCPGDLMLIRDHINMTGINPLRGTNKDELGPRFPDMTYAYEPILYKLMLKKANEIGLTMKEGIYAMMPGPSYETPAEITMLRGLGADAVGMSTVPEVIAAVHAGINVLGISCISNMAAGVSDNPLSHEEVLATVLGTSKVLTNLLLLFIKDL